MLILLNESDVEFRRVIKNAVRHSGANISKKHVQLISKIAFVLAEASSSVHNVFCHSNSAGQTVQSAENDILEMTKILLQNEITTNKEKRQFTFVDPHHRGYARIEDGWLKKFFKKPENSLPTDEDAAERRSIADNDLLGF